MSADVEMESFWFIPTFFLRERGCMMPVYSSVGQSADARTGEISFRMHNVLSPSLSHSLATFHPLLRRRQEIKPPSAERESEREKRERESNFIFPVAYESCKSVCVRQYAIKHARAVNGNTGASLEVCWSIKEP